MSEHHSQGDPRALARAQDGSTGADAGAPGAAGPGGADGSSRRAFLLVGLGAFLAGCTQAVKMGEVLPGPAWDARPAPTFSPVPTPEPAGEAVAAHSAARFAGVLPRSSWATGSPVPALMRPMLPVRYITVHHDGMQPFYGDDRRAAADRLDAIRRAHRRENWGDIGYHFAVDRTGTVWEARPLIYQGAHVKDHNEGNVGVVCLGNFDRQRPTDAQFAAVRAHVARLMLAFHVPVSRVKTHQEWAATACPGRNLQSYMVAVRASGVLA